MRLKFYRNAWAAVWLDEDGKTRRISLRTQDRGLAAQRLADLKQSPAGETIAEIFEAYCKDLVHRGKSRDRADTAWKALERSFGHLRDDQVNRPLCRAYAKQRRAMGRQDGTIAKELDLLRAALRWHDRNSAAQFEMPTRPPPRDRYLTRDEYRRLRLAAKRVAPHIYVFIVLGLTTGARRQALLDLTWDRVDFATGRIRLAPGPAELRGGRKGRATVPMTRNARRVLQLAERASVSDYVIEYAGRQVGSVKRGFASACRLAGLEDVSPHVLRHTSAVWMAEAGIPISEIAQYLGHSDSRLTERVYARYSPDYLSRAAAALG